MMPMQERKEEKIPNERRQKEMKSITYRSEPAFYQSREQARSCSVNRRKVSRRFLPDHPFRIPSLSAFAYATATY